MVDGKPKFFGMTRFNLKEAMKELVLGPNQDNQQPQSD